VSLTQIRICVVVYSIFLYLLVSITEGVSSQSKDSKENEPRDLELCGYCLKEFPVVDLVQHASSCSSRSEHENVVMEQCRYCWMLFPLGDLFNHNGVCPAKKETNSQYVCTVRPHLSAHIHSG
jgi:hypothetical protein